MFVQKKQTKANNINNTLAHCIEVNSPHSATIPIMIVVLQMYESTKILNKFQINLNTLTIFFSHKVFILIFSTNFNLECFRIIHVLIIP